MAYIGAEPAPGQNRAVDDISSSFNGSTTAFTLQVSGVNFSPESANNILVSLGGVMQKPGTDYTIAAATITFTTAPASGLSFWALILGDGIDTATVADQTIGPSKLLNTAVTAGSYTTADITVDAQGRITAAANGTIAQSEIANDAIGADQLASNSVVSASIVDGSIVNADINASAAIAKSKLAALDIVNADVNASAAIAGSKLADDSISLAKLEHGTSSNDGKFLRANNGADPTFETVTGTTINNQGDKRVITGDASANTLNAKSNVVIDSSSRLILGTAGASREVGDVTSQMQVEGIGFASSSLSLISNAGASAGNTPHLTLGKSRGSSAGSNTIVADDDALGQIQFAGADGTDCNSVAASIIGRVDGTPGGNAMPGRLVFSTTAAAAASPTERMKIDSTGDVTISDGDLVIGTAGHGIDFSATADGSGSNQAELLDDYEEGTWTGTINVGTYSVFNTFRYTKIGRFVMLNGGLIINNTTDSAEFQISGLPFAGNGDQFIGNVWLRRTSTGDKKYIATIGQSGASIISYQHDSNGNDMGGAIAYSNFQNSSTYNNFTISYFTNS